MFDALRARLDRLMQPRAGAALQRAATRIKDKLAADATTGRGNVPSYGKFGDVPIAVDVRSGSISVTAADWVMAKATELGQPSEWADIAKEEALADLRGHR
jgi:hypothetical protein